MANERQQVINIAYGGYTTTPSDYDCEDGDLATAIGVVNEDGGLKPVLPPGILAHFADAAKVFIHKNNGYTHYIVSDGHNFWWCEDDWDLSTTPFLSLADGEETVSMEAVGHMLMVSTESNIYYCLWKDKNNDYALLGTDVPDIKMAFALKGELYSHKQKKPSTLKFVKDEVTTDEQWSTLATCAFAFESNLEDKGKNYAQTVTYAFDSSYKIESGTEYALSLAYTISLPQGTLYLWGTKADGTDYCVGTFALSRKRRTFTATEEYTNLRFYFRGTFPSSYYYTNTLVLEKGVSDSSEESVSLEYTEEAYTTMMGIMNSFVNEQATEQNRFIYPFYLRYAVKMYDGTYLHTSAPVFMAPNTGYVPFIYSDQNERLITYGILATLQYEFMDNVSEDWKDLIQGVDIFVSQPIYPYNQGQAFDEDKQLFFYKRINHDTGLNTIKGVSYCNVNATENGVSFTSGSYKHLDFYDILNDRYGFGDSATATRWNVIQVAPDEEGARKDLAKVSTFYHVCNIPFEDIQYIGKFKDVDMEDGTLSTLATRTPLTDELLSNRTFKTGKMFAYNNRLHLYSASYQLPVPDFIGEQNQYLTRANSTDHVTSVRDIYVFVRTDDGERVVHRVVSETEQGYFTAFLASITESDAYGLSWFFYPDNRAYRILFLIKSGYFVDVKLKQHDYLNGSYWMADDINGGLPFSPDSDWEVVEETGDIVAAPHTVYVSEANNPFTFTSQLTVNIGCNEIIGLSSAAKAMSTGQFGQYPLYAFTDNGVWALETSSTGSYTARQPITRDVCINAESITQLDGEVLFATARGIMDLSGSTSTCLSDSLEADKQFVITDIMTDAQAEALLGYVNSGNGTEITLESLKAWGAVSFFEFIKTCRILYDYIHQRIIVYNPQYAYAYVYSIKGKSWGLIRCDIKFGINSYPEAQAIDGGSNLVDFSLSDATGINGLVVTRPLKMGLADVHKTVDTLIQRGYFKEGHVGQVLYASNDLFSWKGVWSSTNKYLRGFSGSPFKYFRLALVCKLDADESLSGLTVRFEPKLTNRPR